MNTTDNTVAATILEQLGGVHIGMMVGAKSITLDGRKLKVRFAAKSLNKSNRFEVELADDDTYTVSFWKISRGGLECKKLSETEMVYANGLRQVVEQSTGLYLSL